MSMTAAQAKQLGATHCQGTRPKAPVASANWQPSSRSMPAGSASWSRATTLTQRRTGWPASRNCWTSSRARIDRLTKGSVAESLPEVRTYFRAKYGLTPEQGEEIERYVARYIEPPEERAP